MGGGGVKTNDMGFLLWCIQDNHGEKLTIPVPNLINFGYETFIVMNMDSVIRSLLQHSALWKEYISK